MSDAPTFDTALIQDTLTGEGRFTPEQARSLTRALSLATTHLPSRDGLETFKADVRAGLEAVRRDLADKLTEQTWRVLQIVLAAVVLNALVVAGTGLALYNALKP